MPGEVLPYLKGRIEAYGRSSALVTDPPRPSRPIGDYLANLYVDTVCYHYEALACCYQVLGAEHLLFGTDHPFDAYQVPADLLDKLDCPSSHRDMIITAMPNDCLVCSLAWLFSPPRGGPAQCACAAPPLPRKLQPASRRSGQLLRLALF
jgi:hypothetical protein